MACAGALSRLEAVSHGVSFCHTGIPKIISKPMPAGQCECQFAQMASVSQSVTLTLFHLLQVQYAVAKLELEVTLV